MRPTNTILILAVAFLAVFLQAAVGTGWLGAQIDLLPALVVYASLTGGLPTVALVAVCGGLWFDSLSANPLGVTMLPLFLVGFAISRRRELILRDQLFAQFILGLFASAVTPLAVMLLLLSGGRSPIVGWGTIWQWLVMSLGGALLTPALFHFFRFVNGAFFFPLHSQSSFRHDRQIRRGRF